MTLVKWKPMNSMFDVFNDMDKLFNNYRINDSIINDDDSFWIPSFDIIESNNSFILSTDLPGLEKKDINIDINDRLLTISGERKTNIKKDNDDWLYNELRYGRFSRSFTLPESINENKIKANFKNGVLNLEIEKIKPIKTKFKKIEIS